MGFLRRARNGKRYAFLLAATLICSVGNRAAPRQACDASVIRGVDQAELDRETNLTGYSVTERYTLRNGRFQASAEMTVATVYRKGVGKSYQVLSRSGSSAVQTGVFDKLLLEEAEMSRGNTRQHVLATSANYKMRIIGEESLAGRQCEVLELIPRTKSAHLLKGRAWVDAKDHSLMRIEGKPGVSPAFWAGRPMIVREYERIDGFSLARKSHALSDSLLLGKTELTIEYSDYKVTGTEK
jgi:hypothetical protein